MQLFRRQNATSIRALLSFAALVAISSTIVPGATPHRARPVRGAGHFVQRLALSRSGSDSAVVLPAEVPRLHAAAAAPAIPPFPLAAVRALLLPGAPARWTRTVLVPPPLFARPWRTLSRLESRPPPIA